jgi:hypothetical protein
MRDDGFRMKDTFVTACRFLDGMPFVVANPLRMLLQVAVTLLAMAHAIFSFKW